MGDSDDLWRLPPALRGRDVRLTPAAGPPALSSSPARGRRLVTKAPEVVVKLTGRARGTAGHLREQLDYITRGGRLSAETHDGEIVTDRDRLREIHDEWLLANAAEGRGKGRANAAQSVALTLSMPPGTPADRVEAAARQWARDTFADRHDWLLARHDDTGHPHVHIAVRAVGRDGHRLAPGPADLQRWRERFARDLRRLGVEAEATPPVPRDRVRAPHQHESAPRAAVIGQPTPGPEVRSPGPPSPPPAHPEHRPGLHRASLPRTPDHTVWPRPRGRG